jgi:large subunit ribosomal protein L41
VFCGIVSATSFGVYHTTPQFYWRPHITLEQDQGSMGLLDGLITGFARKSKFGRSHSLRPLTSKRANRRFYKGNGCRNEGTHAKRGRYVVDQDKLLQLEVPDLTGFKVRPQPRRLLCLIGY